MMNNAFTVPWMTLVVSGRPPGWGWLPLLPARQLNSGARARAPRRF